VRISISRDCAAAAPDSRFEIGDWDTRALAPVLTDAQAAIVCRKDKELDYGTHTVFMGRIISISINGDVDPLIYLDGAIYRPRRLSIRPARKGRRMLTDRIGTADHA